VTPRGKASKLKHLQSPKQEYLKKVEPTTTATAKPAMRYAPLDLSDTGGPSLNLKKKKALNPSLKIKKRLTLAYKLL
jgi:hypothetical protein